MTQIGKTSGPCVKRVANALFEVSGLPDLSPLFRVRAEAEKHLRAELAKMPESQRPRSRPCLCCKRAFDSEGPHNRLCHQCRNRSETFSSVGSLARASGPGRLSSAAKRFGS